MSQKFRFNIPHDYALDLSIEPELEGMVYSGPNGSVSIGFENLDKQSISDSIQSFFDCLESRHEIITPVSMTKMSGLSGSSCRYVVGDDHYYTEIELYIDVPDARLPVDTLSLILRADSLAHLHALEHDLNLPYLIDVC